MRLLIVLILFLSYHCFPQNLADNISDIPKNLSNFHLNGNDIITGSIDSLDMSSPAISLNPYIIFKFDSNFCIKDTIVVFQNYEKSFSELNNYELKSLCRNLIYMILR